MDKREHFGTFTPIFAGVVIVDINENRCEVVDVADGELKQFVVKGKRVEIETVCISKQ